MCVEKICILLNWMSFEVKLSVKEHKDGIFKQIVFVSKESRENFVKLFPHCEKKAIYCNNLINGRKIIEKSEWMVTYWMNLT